MMSSFVWLKELYFIDFEWAFTDPEETVVLYPKSVRSSALCGALHKADYVDRSIMWTIGGGMFRTPCAAWLFGD
jgi:hypothetical protein